MRERGYRVRFIGPRPPFQSLNADQLDVLVSVGFLTAH